MKGKSMALTKEEAEQILTWGHGQNPGPWANHSIEAIFALKKHFDERCGINVYDLFYDEIRDVSFR